MSVRMSVRFSNDVAFGNFSYGLHLLTLKGEADVFRIGFL